MIKTKVSSINDVTALVAGGVKDSVTTILNLVLKSVTIGLGVRNFQKLSDVT